MYKMIGLTEDGRKRYEITDNAGHVLGHTVMVDRHWNRATPLRTDVAPRKFENVRSADQWLQSVAAGEESAIAPLPAPPEMVKAQALLSGESSVPDLNAPEVQSLPEAVVPEPEYVAEVADYVSGLSAPKDMADHEFDLRKLQSYLNWTVQLHALPEKDIDEGQRVVLYGIDRKKGTVLVGDLVHGNMTLPFTHIIMPGHEHITQ